VLFLSLLNGQISDTSIVRSTQGHGRYVSPLSFDINIEESGQVMISIIWHSAVSCLLVLFHQTRAIIILKPSQLFPGSSEKPSFPLNILADFAGGGMACVIGILLALIERGKSSRGQVIEVDMVGCMLLCPYCDSIKLPGLWHSLSFIFPSSKHPQPLSIIPIRPWS